MEHTAPLPPTQDFLQAYRGSFINMLRWPQLESLWQTLRARADAGWYIYAVGEPPPDSPASAEQLDTFISEIDTLLRTEHEEDYCGIVYADDREEPNFVKIYDPNNLGSVCGTSGAPPPFPGWILSRLRPADLPVALPPPGNRRRWWRRLFGSD